MILYGDGGGFVWQGSAVNLKPEILGYSDIKVLMNIEIYSHIILHQYEGQIRIARVRSSFACACTSQSDQVRAVEKA